MGPSDLAGAADRAGAVVRDQIESMVEAATTTAADVERQARDSAQESRREAVASGRRIVDGIGSMERELARLLTEVSKEGDSLRAKVDRAKLLSVPGPAEPSGLSGVLEAEGAAFSPELTGGQEPTDQGDRVTQLDAGMIGGDDASAAVVTEEDIQSEDVETDSGVPAGRASEAEHREEEDAVVPVDLEAEGETAQADELSAEPDSDRAERLAAEAADLPKAMAAIANARGLTPRERFRLQRREQERRRAAARDTGHATPHDLKRRLDEEAGQGPPATLEEEARTRVADKTDVELAELHRIAHTRLADIGDEAEQAYWDALVRATVTEAVARPEFGESSDEDPPGGRRAKRQRAKDLQALMEARERLKSSAADDDLK